MRVVLDTNVLVSAAVTPRGVSADVLRRAREGKFELVTSPAVLIELWRVLSRPPFRRYLSLDAALRFVQALRHHSELVDDPSDVPAVTRDPKDDFVVALAAVSRADAIVSGDSDLTELQNPPVAILTPRGLLDELDT